MTHRSGNILIDARLLAYRRGGIVRYVTALIDWLPRLAPDLAFRRVINRETPPSAMPDLRVRTPPHFRFERATLGAELAIRRPALIHSPDFIAPLALGARRVVTVHDLAFLRRPDLLAAGAQRYYQQIEQSLAVADRVIAVSNYTACQLRDLTHVDAAKIVTIHNGVDLPKAEISHDEAGRRVNRELDHFESARILTDRPIILMVGTIEPRKRQQLVLQALEQEPLSSASVAPLVVLVGQRGWSCGPILAAIERSTAVGRAVWLDHASDRVLAALYRLATVLALPSIDEGFGLALLEAMAAGLPVVAARRGALPEVAGEAALFVDEDDAGAWSAALATLLDDEARREALRSAGRERAAEFTWERTARATAALYREVLLH